MEEKHRLYPRMRPEGWHPIYANGNLVHTKKFGSNDTSLCAGGDSMKQYDFSRLMCCNNATPTGHQTLSSIQHKSATKVHRHSWKKERKKLISDLQDLISNVPSRHLRPNNCLAIGWGSSDHHHGCHYPWAIPQQKCPFSELQ